MAGQWKHQRMQPALVALPPHCRWPHSWRTTLGPTSRRPCLRVQPSPSASRTEEVRTNLTALSRLLSPCVVGSTSRTITPHATPHADTASTPRAAPLQMLRRRRRHLITAQSATSRVRCPAAGRCAIVFRPARPEPTDYLQLVDVDLYDTTGTLIPRQVPLPWPGYWRI